MAETKTKKEITFKDIRLVQRREWEIKDLIPYVDKHPCADREIEWRLREIGDIMSEKYVVKFVKNTKLKKLGWGYMTEPDYKSEDHIYFGTD